MGSAIQSTDRERLGVANTIPLLTAGRLRLNQRRQGSRWHHLFDLLDAVKDPEIPVLSIWDLGVLQDVAANEQGGIHVVITPTWTGCPAMMQICDDIQAVLRKAGYSQVTIEERLTPAWTTDWLAPDARRRLIRYGVAAPHAANCPQCGSSATALVSECGATSCKALYRCTACLEPFEYFKPL